MDAISEAKLKELNPQLAARIRTMVSMLETENIVVRIVQGLRTWNQQQQLWQQGRNASGNVTGRTVTDARGGYSWHNFGLAVDVAPFDDGIPDWNENHAAWQRIVAVGESNGLKAGATFRTFPDWPHFQPQELSDTPTDEDRQDFVDAGMTSVWQKYNLQEATI